MANEILKFATNVTAGNILTQSAYSAPDPSPRTVGHVPGIASNQLENKVLTQASAVCNGIGDWLDTRQSVVADITDQLAPAAWLNAWDAAVATVVGSNVLQATTAVVGKTRYATAGEMVTGTLTTAAVTPNLLGPLTASFASNGFARLPGGLIVQWGQTANVASGAGTAQPLPLTFPTAAYQAMAVGVLSSNTAAVISFTTSSIQLMSQNVATVRWFIVGS